MSEISPDLVLKKIKQNLINDMAKLRIKSDIINPYGGFSPFSSNSTAADCVLSSTVTLASDEPIFNSPVDNQLTQT